ncbi:MAG TPA: SMEK domain-containing protein [Cyclobacteriaceae bacterium]|jgi:hypothetical protein|nr:SMEK domain-containing protein [Cyclobacteriaceae bacterium]
MYSREVYISEIAKSLASLQNEIALRNSLNLLDINIHTEDFFKKLLNKINGYDLKNLNLSAPNTKTIDLADRANGVAFQITSDNSKRKIQNTVVAFYQDELYKEYKLKILITKGKVKKYEPIVYTDFQFDFNLDVIDIQSLLRSLMDFDVDQLRDISQWIASELQNPITVFHAVPEQQDFDRFFLKFLNNDIDVNTLLARAQPTLADCREIFSEEFYREIHNIYLMHYYSMLEIDPNLNDKFRDKDNYKTKFSSFAEIRSDIHNLPKGMSSIFKLNALRPGKFNYYTISFISKESSDGLSFSIWVFINGRWVFFPKPWRIINVLYDMKSSKTFRVLIKILRAIGFHKAISKEQSNGIFAMTYLLRELAKE